MITGVFVDSAIQTSNSQRDIQIEREMELKDSFLKSLKGFFEALDTDGSGSIHLEEIKIMLQDGPDIENARKYGWLDIKLQVIQFFVVQDPTLAAYFAATRAFWWCFLGGTFLFKNGGFYWKSRV